MNSRKFLLRNSNLDIDSRISSEKQNGFFSVTQCWLDTGFHHTPIHLETARCTELHSQREDQLHKVFVSTVCLTEHC